ncbi:hypothetical protein CFP66_13450 [Pseudonocardia sp. MH-G8]|nr:hypothetical protein CFP66_13450 [Pseudonocardia sp. MH-G8]
MQAPGTSGRPAGRGARMRTGRSHPPIGEPGAVRADVIVRSGMPRPGRRASRPRSTKSFRVVRRVGPTQR